MFNAVSELISELSGGVVADSIIGLLFLLFGLSVQKIRKRLYRRRFKRAFGFVVDGGSNFAVSIPLWTLKSNDRDVPRFVKVNPWQAGKSEEFFGPSETFSSEDTKASRELAAILAEVFPQPPLILPDSQGVQYENKTVLMIGAPIANFHARGIFQEDVLGLGSTRPYIFVEKEESAASPSRVYLYDSQTRNGHHADHVHDAAIVQRVRNPYCDDGYLFIVAGSHAEGTFGAARYLRKNWESIAKQPIGSSVGVLLKVDRNNPEVQQVLTTSVNVDSQVAHGHRRRGLFGSRIRDGARDQTGGGPDGRGRKGP